MDCFHISAPFTQRASLKHMIVLLGELCFKDKQIFFLPLGIFLGKEPVGYSSLYWGSSTAAQNLLGLAPMDEKFHYWTSPVVKDVTMDTFVCGR